MRDASGRAAPGSDPQLLFTENETNHERLFGSPNRTPYVKDAFHRFVVRMLASRLDFANREVAGLQR